MPDQRTNRAVAERLDLQLERYPNPLHRRRRWFTLVGGVLALLFVGYFLARGDHSVFMSQPVAESHQHFQADCQTCHQAPWQPLIRLASSNPNATTVQDQACHQCHDQRKHDHNAFAMAKGVPDCAECHQEHRGTIDLTDEADASCVKCHDSFEHHPQFSLMRRWPLNQKLSASQEATMKQLKEVATLQTSDNDAQTMGGHWQDKTSLKFSHARHLAPLVARWKPGTDETSPAQPTQLICADCHQPDAGGQAMQPIVFEKHCRECHPLRFSSKLDVSAALAPSDLSHSLPHAQPKMVRALMRERLIAYARRHPSAVLAPVSRLPNRPASRTPTPKQEWQWVEEQLEALEAAIFRTPTHDGAAHDGNACLKCHEAEAVSSATAPGFSIVPPRIPERWMPHAQFRHDRHRQMECLTCHQASTSETVQDILMPSKHICQTCHGATSGALPQIRRARKNCTECHQYHHVHVAKVRQ